MASAKWELLVPNNYHSLGEVADAPANYPKALSPSKPKHYRPRPRTDPKLRGWIVDL